MDPFIIFLPPLLYRSNYYSSQIYIAPSGVQKERICPEDIFVQDIAGQDLELPPPEKKLKKSQCTPLFMCAYISRNAGAVIHTHSKFAVMATLLWPGTEFRVTHLEMIKGNSEIIHSWID